MHGEIAMDTAPAVSIIVVSTNEAPVLDVCLGSVLKNDVDFEVIVVNNASTDATATLVATKFADPRVRMVTNARRFSLSENCNIGLREARGRYILILNPDTELEPDTIVKMIRFMDRTPDCAFSTCRLFNRDGSPQDHIRRFPAPIPVLIRLLRLDRLYPQSRIMRRYLMRDFDRSKTQEVEWFILAFFFIRRSALEHIGPVDERFVRPYYCEDIEWCYRARFHGFRNYCVAEARAFHDYQQRSRKTFGRLTFVHAANNLLLYQKVATHRFKKRWSRFVGAESAA